MKSNVELDQSGRIEMTGDTVIAVANGFTVTVRITGKVKDVMRQALRNKKVKPKMRMIRMFVGAIVLAVRDHNSEIATMKLDAEYAGYESQIRSLLIDRLRAAGEEFDTERIVIVSVRKKSPAHRAAIRVTRGQAKADYTPSAQELLDVC